MGNRGKHMIFPKEDMVDLECSPLSNSHDMGYHLHEHLQCLQHRLETILSVGRLRPLLLHQDNFVAHLADPLLPSQRNDFSRLQNRGEQLFQGLPICLHYQRFPMPHTMKIIRATISRTWAGPTLKLHSAWSKQNPP